MNYSSKQAEQSHLLRTADAMAAAARTAPKTKGQDYLCTAVLTGEELEALAREMDRIAAEQSVPFFARDAGCVRKSGAVLLLGIGRHPRGLDGLCNFCGLGGCAACRAAGATCAFDSLDLGIAAGAAASVAADRRVDSRIMFSAGTAGRRFLPAECAVVLGIPLSISGKSPYFDR